MRRAQWSRAHAPARAGASGWDKVVRDAGASLGHGIRKRSAFGKPRGSRTRSASALRRLRAQGCFPLSGSLSPREPRIFGRLSRSSPNASARRRSRTGGVASSARTRAAAPPLSKTAPSPAPPLPGRRPCHSTRVTEYRNIFRIVKRALTSQRGGGARLMQRRLAPQALRRLSALGGEPPLIARRRFLRCYAIQERALRDRSADWADRGLAFS